MIRLQVLTHFFSGASMDHQLVKTLQELVVNKSLHQLIALFQIMEHLKRMLMRETVSQGIHHSTLKGKGRTTTTQ